MRYFGISIVALAMAMAGDALAADKVLIGPAPAWVRPVPIHTAMPVDASEAYAVLNLNNQVRFAPGPDNDYWEVAFRIQTPQGLEGMGPNITWAPEVETVTVHKVQILRGNEVIDLLAQGQTFTTLRREARLDQSMLDGRLTAVLQPEGLRVGDILVYAYTTQRDDPLAGDRSEDLFFGKKQAIGRFTYRAEWPAAMPIRWRHDPELPVRISEAGGNREFAVDMENYKMPEAPERAPGRFKRFGLIELSQFARWEDLSALEAPLYATAATLKPESPLKAEVARIRALSDDPKVQAAAALSLVQDQIRYVYIGDNLGHYRPAEADVTWTRRFGDCKGKSALLLALLNELGIEAQPALVATTGNNGMNERLPMMGLFDHVIVRAVIGGKTYWLDGTRSGDEGLDIIPVPDYQWALPLTAKGSPLDGIVPALPDKPLTERSWHIDARGGLDAPAPFRIETVLRGQAGLDSHLAYASQTEAEIDEALRKRWKDTEWLTVTKVSQSWDAATGEQRSVIEGTAKMAWKVTQTGKPRRFEADGYQTVEDYEMDRKPGRGADAPVTLTYPYFDVDRETILLPRNGKGFSIVGEAVDTTLAGMEIRRTLRLKDGAFFMEESTRTLTGEVPLDQVTKDDPEIKRLHETGVWLQSPYDYIATDADKKAVADAEPKTVEAYVARISAYAEAGQYDKAMADANAAVALDPKSSVALAMRAAVKVDTKDVDGAMADLDTALKLNPRDATALLTRALIYMSKGDHAKAIEGLTRVLDVDPTKSQARRLRSESFLAQGDKERALDDALTVAAMEPDSGEAALFLAQTYVELERPDDAIAALQTAVKTIKDDADLFDRLGDLLSDCGDLTGEACEARDREAVAAYDAAIALTPTAQLLADRASARPDSERAAALGDLNRALELEPDDDLIRLMRIYFYARGEDYDQALTDIEIVLANDPGNILALQMRSEIREQRGDIDGYIADADAVLAQQPDSAEYLNGACWARASYNRELDKAMELCNAALKIAPDSAPTLDSRGMIHLQAGRWAEAEADYDAALKAGGEFASALYGRGIARLRLGKTKEGKADLKAARALSADVEKTFAGHGIKQ